MARKRQRKTKQSELFPKIVNRAPEALVEAMGLVDDGAQIIASVSGGKDSQAMVDYLVQLLRWQGLNPAQRLILVNADLGDAEWPVADHLQGLAAHYGLELHIVKPNRDLLTSIEQRGMWPSKKARYCTSDHKRAPIQKFIRHTARERGWSNIIHCMGERAEESTGRKKLLEHPLVVDDALTFKSGKRRVWTWHAIVDLELPGVWRRIEASGYPAHPIYAEGMSRLSCSFCVFGKLSDLRIAKRLRPELHVRMVGMEARMGHSFKAKFKLSDLDTAEDDGMTGPT